MQAHHHHPSAHHHHHHHPNTTSSAHPSSSNSHQLHTAPPPSGAVVGGPRGPIVVPDGLPSQSLNGHPPHSHPSAPIVSRTGRTTPISSGLPAGSRAHSASRQGHQHQPSGSIGAPPPPPSHYNHRQARSSLPTVGPSSSRGPNPQGPPSSMQLPAGPVGIGRSPSPTSPGALDLSHEGISGPHAPSHRGSGSLGPGEVGGLHSIGAPGSSHTVDVHNSAVTWAIEKGHMLNAEAAREIGFERREALPPVLDKLEAETDECYSTIATINYNMGNFDKALKNFEKALAKNPYNLKALVGMVRWLKDKDTNNHNRIIDFSLRSLAVDSTGEDGEMWSALGHALLMLGQLQKAYACFQHAIAKCSRKDDPKLWYGIGVLYDRYGSMEHAEEAFASVLKVDPHFSRREEVFFRLGIIYKLQGKPDASLECFHYILEDPPDPLRAVDVWYQIGHSLELKKDVAAAKEAYERVLRTTPDHSKVLQHLGAIHLRESSQYNDPEKSIAYITQSLEHDSQDPFSWYLLGRAFMQLNNYGKAYEAYQQAVYRDGKNPAYWCSIGVLYFNINQFHDALDAYTRAVRLHPFIPEIWQNLGTLYESCHDQLADAMDAYQRAVQLEPSNAPLVARLAEIKAALQSGNDVAAIQASIQPPPVPEDITPDSKSWATIHFDVNASRPVYLDSKAVLNGQASYNGDNSNGGSPDGLNGSNATSASNSASDPRAMPSPPGLANGPSGHVGPASHVAANGSGRPSSPRASAIAAERLSMARPGSSHSRDASVGAPYPPGGHPLDDPVARSRHHHHHHHSSQAAPTGRPLPSSAMSTTMELDRDSRRIHTVARPGYLGADQHSPATSHDAAFSRHPAHSPLDSPRLHGAGRPGSRGQAALSEYDFPGHQGHPYPSPGAEIEWERQRVREMRDRDSRIDRERYLGSNGAPMPRDARDDGRRHGGLPPAGSSHHPSPPHEHLPQHVGYQGSPAAYGRDYPAGHGQAHPPAATSRRAGSPQPVRYDERAAPTSGNLPPRSHLNTRFGHPYSYDSYYSGVPPAGALYADARNNGGGRYSGSDPRYDAMPLDPRERELLHEREVQARRAIEEDERRRREVESSRREISPPSVATKTTPERRGVFTPGGADRGGNGPERTVASSGKSKGRKGVNGDDSAQSGQSQAGSAVPSPMQAPSKERKRKIVGAVAMDGGRKKQQPPSAELSAATPTSAGKIKIRVGSRPPAKSTATASPPDSTASYANNTPYEGGSSRRMDEDYDDETDTANALIGLAGAAVNAASITSGASRRSTSPSAGTTANLLKRPLSPNDDHPGKRPRSEEDMLDAREESTA